MEVIIQVNGQPVAVEVTVEVYEYLIQAEHKDENLLHEQRRHWDGRGFDEYIVFAEGRSYYSISPEQWVCREETMQEIHAALMCCTENQRRRFLLHAIEKMSYSEIGHVCGCSKVSVYESIRMVRKKVKEILTNHPNDLPFSG